ncbi:MAG: type II toxin-antitoxin system VapC family toxin [Bacteroidota bacterium]
MIYFFDSSALLKRYFNENGSAAVGQLINVCSDIYISDITKIECISVLRRYYYDRKITKEQYIEFKNLMLEEFTHFKNIEVDSHLIYSAIDFLDDRYLKSLDCIQFVSFSTHVEKFSALVSCDNRLNQMAYSLNLTVLNPLEI